MLPVIEIGPMSLPTQPFLLLIGIWLGMWAAEKYAPRTGVDPKHLSNLILLGLVTGVLGARLGYVLQHIAAFASNPLSALMPSLQMLSLDAGLLAGGLAAYIYAQKRNLVSWQTLDALTPGLAVFAIAFWLGAFASGEAYGTPSNLPWAVDLWGQARHPAQLYAALGAGLAAWLSWPRGEPGQASGVQFLTFCAWSAASMLLVETWRGDPTPHIFNTVRAGQALAWLALAASLYLIGRRRHASPK